MQILKEKIQSTFKLSDDDFETLISLFTFKRFVKNEYFAKNGEYSKQMAFVTSGVLRAFF